MRLESGIQAAFYGVTRAIMAPAVGVYFRRLELLGGARLPAHGPVLLVANHPASLADVLILGVLLGRRLRFVGSSGLFRFRLHGAFLRACGALPIWRPEDAGEYREHNAETFAGCHEAFDRGDVVVMFPEGLSRADRSIAPFRSGAARLAVSWARRPGRAGRLRIVPAGLIFSRRGGFRSDATLSLGPAMRVDAGHEPNETSAVIRLNALVHEAVRREIAPVGERRERLAHAVEALALDSLAREAGADRVRAQRAIAAAIEREHRRDPLRLERFERRLTAWLAALDALDLDGAILIAPPVPPLATRLARAAVALLGALPALIGAAIHAPVVLLAVAGGRIFGRDDTHLAFARIMTALAAFAAQYALLGALLAGRGFGAVAVMALLASSAALGGFALAYFPWLDHQRRLRRLAGLRAAGSHRIAALRTRGLRLLRQVRAAVRAQHVVRPVRPARRHAEAGA